MSPYEPGDYIKVDFPDEVTGIGEWKRMCVTRTDDERQLVFGTLDDEPLENMENRLRLGSELAVSYGPNSRA